MKKVICALSGGVDSAVSAWLLMQQGYQVEALFMKNWEEDDNQTHCEATQDALDAKAVCEHLKIPLHQVNFAGEYWQHVFSNFIEEYQQGRTPNPDILCNREIKFKAFVDAAKELGGEFMATGHYVNRKWQDGQWQLLKGVDPNKDQSYFLHSLDQQQIAYSLFPIGSLQKTKVREIAQEIGLPNHQKKDSTGICFIGERRFNQFIKQYVDTAPGPIVNTQGVQLGDHEGLACYTIGQRKGLQIGGIKDTDNKPWYVVEKNLTINTLVVAREDDPALYQYELTAHQCHWINNPAPEKMFRCSAKTRYRQHDVACCVYPLGPSQAKVVFETPQRAITPGQSVVFYDDNICLGGGIINERK